mgnify:CR=1 FL=1
MLHLKLAGKRDDTTLSFVDEGFFTDKGITWLSGETVTGILLDDKAIQLESGATVPYDKLLIATGASSFIPPVAGVIIAGYWIIGKGKPENFHSLPGVNPAGVIAFVLGAAVAWVTANVLPFFSGPINGIVVSLVAYVVLNKLMPAKAAPKTDKQEAA